MIKNFIEVIILPHKVFKKKKKKDILKISQTSQQSTCARVSFLINLQAWTCNFIPEETLAQVFSCKFCEIFRNTFFQWTPLDDCF